MALSECDLETSLPVFVRDFVASVASGDMGDFFDVMHPDCRPVVKATGEVVVMDLDAFAEALTVLYADTPDDYEPKPNVALVGRDEDSFFFLTHLRNAVGMNVRLRHTLCRCDGRWRIVQSMSIFDA